MHMSQYKTVKYIMLCSQQVQAVCSAGKSGVQNCMPNSGKIPPCLKRLYVVLEEAHCIRSIASYACLKS